MYRRIRSLANLQNTTKALDKAKQKGKGVDEVRVNWEKILKFVCVCVHTLRQRVITRKLMKSLNNIQK